MARLIGIHVRCSLEVGFGLRCRAVEVRCPLVITVHPGYDTQLGSASRLDAWTRTPPTNWACIVVFAFLVSWFPTKNAYPVRPPRATYLTLCDDARLNAALSFCVKRCEGEGASATCIRCAEFQTPCSNWIMTQSSFGVCICRPCWNN